VKTVALALCSVYSPGTGARRTIRQSRRSATLHRLEGIVEVMNERRLDSLTIPVLGSGHGGMPLPIAILFDILALRSISSDEIGRRLRKE
jgi:hypothetical protein